MSRRSRNNRPAAPVNPATSPGKPGVRRDAYYAAGVCAFLLFAVMLVFGQTIGHGFINVDDQEYVIWNNEVKDGLTLHGVQWAFASKHAANWHPLTWLSHMADCQLYGPSAAAGRSESGEEQKAAGCLPYNRFAGGHHLTNVLLHAANAILLFLVLWRMTGSLWPSAFAAALFALHPLRVESVAWVSERKDLLSGFFFLATLAAYVGYAWRQFSIGRYLAVVVLFALGLMAKPMVVTLPFVLLLLDFWPLKRFSWFPCSAWEPSVPDAPRPVERSHAERGNEIDSGRQECLSRPSASWQRLIFEKLPLLVLSAASCMVTLWAQRVAIVANEPIEFPLRLANSLTSLVGYLTQWFYPANLAAMYPFPCSGVHAGRIAVAVVVLAAISLAVLIARRRHPFLLVGWLWYLGMLVPVIGLVQVGAQAMADRYTYLPQIGLAVALAWLAAAIVTSRPRWRLPIVAAASLVLLNLILCAAMQASYWQDNKTLWSHALDCTENNWYAHEGLAAALSEVKDYDGAIAEFERARAISPGQARIRFHLARVLERRGAPGDVDAAETQYREGLTMDPTYADAHYNLGVLLVNRGKTAEAIVEFRDAIKYEPEHANAHYNLAFCLEGQGKYVQAMPHWNAVARLQPDNADTLDEVAWRLATYPDASVRNGTRSLELARQAVALTKGQAARPMSTLAAAYAELGRFDEAVQAAQRAIDLAMQHGDMAVAEDIRAQRKLYREHHPYHGSPGQPQ